VFENRVLRTIFGHKMDEVTGGWRELQLEVDCEDVDWINLAQDRNRWVALVNTVLRLHVP
jgi:hypothetical protein